MDANLAQLNVQQGPTPVVVEPAIDSELVNDIVTVSKLQVALRGEAHTFQAKLNELATSADTTTTDGLFNLLQQTATLLLDYSNFWSHVLASSRTIDGRDAAQVLFDQLSLQERSKFAAETLTNVDGVVSRHPAPAVGLVEEPAYIVVTLLMGTADDRPLFNEIYTASVLRDVLKDITLMRSYYLLVMELLWTPQDVNDSLTEADLAKDYADLVAIS